MRRILLLNALLLSTGLSYAMEGGQKEAIEFQKKLNDSESLNEKPKALKPRSCFNNKVVKTGAKCGRNLLVYGLIAAVISEGVAISDQSNHPHFVTTALRYHNPPLPKDTAQCKYTYLTSCYDGYHRAPDNMKECKKYVKQNGTYILEECDKSTQDPQFGWGMTIAGAGFTALLIKGTDDLASCLAQGSEQEDNTPLLEQSANRCDQLTKVLHGVTYAAFATSAVAGTVAMAESESKDPQLASGGVALGSSLTGLITMAISDYLKYGK